MRHSRMVSRISLVQKVGAQRVYTQYWPFNAVLHPIVEYVRRPGFPTRQTRRLRKAALPSLQDR